LDKIPPHLLLLHRFAAWTASRAIRAEKGIDYPAVFKIMDSLGYVKKISHITYFDKYSDKHEGLVVEIKERLKKAGAKSTFGIAAKILAVYLKTAVIIPNIHSPVSTQIYPPIDSQVLKYLTSRGCTKLPKSWKAMTISDYNKVILAVIETSEGKPLWEIDVNAWGVVEG
jgi:hypothetical protein